MDIHGDPWKSMEVHGSPWMSIEVHGSPLRRLHMKDTSYRRIAGSAWGLKHGTPRTGSETTLFAAKKNQFFMNDTANCAIAFRCDKLLEVVTANQH